MKVGSILKYSNTELSLVEKLPSGLNKLVWSKDTQLLIFDQEDNYLLLNPREVSGMRLFIEGQKTTLIKLLKDQTLCYLIQGIAKSFQCRFIQIQSEQLDLKDHLDNGFYFSNIILKKDLSKPIEEISSSLIERKLDKKYQNEYALNEFMTRVSIPGGTHYKDDFYTLIKAEYKELIELDIDGLDFIEYSLKEYGHDTYYIWMINHHTKTALRCFSWVAPKLRGQSISSRANEEINKSLYAKGVKQCLSFTSFTNIAQVRSSLKAGYKLDRIVILKEVN